MAITATAATAQLTCATRRNISLSSINSLSSPTLTFKYKSLRLIAAASSNPNSRIYASSMSSIQVPEQLSFLDRRESSGFLHFVKYHGLGNDFILVRFHFYSILVLNYSILVMYVLFL